MNYYDLKDSKKFWEGRDKAREARNRKLAKLPFSEKATIAERLRADYEVLQNARDESTQFGLGKLLDSACNKVGDLHDFSRTVGDDCFITGLI